MLLPDSRTGNPAPATVASGYEQIERTLERIDHGGPLVFTFNVATGIDQNLRVFVGKLLRSLFDGSPNAQEPRK